MRRDPRSVTQLSAVLLCVAYVGCGGAPAPDTEGDITDRVASGESTLPEEATVVSADFVERHNHGVALMGRFDYDAASTIFASLLQEAPGSDDIRVDLAIATLNRQQDGDYARAMQLLDEVVEADESSLRANYCRGILLLFEGKARRALDDFQPVAEADPTDAHAAYFVGQCYFELGDFETALSWYKRASVANAYLRSAYYGAFQSCQRLGETDQARELLKQFTDLANNPRSELAEFKYTRMGPKSEVSALTSMTASANATRPDGPVFVAVAPLRLTSNNYAWQPASSAESKVLPHITACDVNHDGRVDLFFTGVGSTVSPNALLIQQVDGSFSVDDQHPLSRVTLVQATLWGDYDNDGLVDVYLCRDGSNQLWRQQLDGAWSDVTKMADVDGGMHDTVDGMFFDADHDGDLDILVVQADGPCELFNNNLDGSFRPIGMEIGLLSDDAANRAVVVADFDRDRDLDILLFRAGAPHVALINDRLWKYHPANGFDELCVTDAQAAVAADTDADGVAEIYTDHSDSIRRWKPDENGIWRPETLPKPPSSASTGRSSRESLSVLDVDGDTRADLICGSNGSWSAFGLDDAAVAFKTDRHDLIDQIPVLLDAARGPAVVGLAFDGAPVIWQPGPGRYGFAAVRFSGRDNPADQMRSNASGIGVMATARIGDRWTDASSLRETSGPGQSLQPRAIGTRGKEKIDFVRMTWPDGVLQTEVNLESGVLHCLVETQRQLSSCPVVFAFDGESMAFVTDMLGVGGMGYNVGAGVYASPRPWENLLLPEQALAADEGKYHLSIAEPMEEVCYLDRVRLRVVDVPPGWHVTVDERLTGAAPLPTGQPRFYRERILPQRAVNGMGQDVTERISVVDLKAAPLAPLDRRFIGRTAPNELTLQFAVPIDRGRGQPALLVDGWVEYPYSQTMFAAWQAGASYDAPSLEVCDAEGNWHTISDEIGYPAGMPRHYVVPLPVDRLPPDATTLRLKTNLEVYWDSLALVWLETCEMARITQVDVDRARLSTVGFPRRTTAAQRVPRYDYSDRSPLWDTRAPAGWYTAFGSVDPLLSDAEGAVVVFGPGEAVDVDFIVPESPRAGWHRRVIVELDGWCKDMDLYTRDGDTVEPLPAGDVAADPGQGEASKRDELHRRYLTRYRDGS